MANDRATPGGNLPYDMDFDDMPEGFAVGDMLTGGSDLLTGGKGQRPLIGTADNDGTLGARGGRVDRTVGADPLGSGSPDTLLAMAADDVGYRA